MFFPELRIQSACLAFLLLVDVLHTSNSLPTVVKEDDFDLYILSMSYQPEFCFMHRHDDFVGCRNPLEFWKGHLTIHGLWPERQDGTWPSTCSNEPFNDSTWADVGPDLERLWPNVKTKDTEEAYTGFWKHEWSKHGTCSGLSQDNYFSAALKLFLDTPSIIAEKYGSTVAKKELKIAYGSQSEGMIFYCNHGRFLSEVRACFGMDSDRLPTSQIPCPEVALEENNCGEEISITSFPSSDDISIM
mmetsp:Transcript_31905/g.48931  ORF Transcript_31905/g.48931 Transcript_31905/m.48931 type:complete len:245 (-) Transcript_31905:87-821(-)|eukprot:CAMPEP_0195293062 /NCGR_PEP_ID=MMETSP0707-20130614/11567_1 /TAXON_ID=33640 /ORGANISM="Asterionellopsis glacialis, Strain CCMP134" /LENGTH=244 /DNA_ID=CAMNT_0040353691 /DNA_START=61 /DNA_END=795 /DNA_ORIENTATION=-